MGVELATAAASTQPPIMKLSKKVPAKQDMIALVAKAKEFTLLDELNELV